MTDPQRTETDWVERSLDRVIARLETMVARIEPDLVGADAAERLVDAFGRAERLCASGRTLLARLIADAKVLAKSAGVTEGEAAQTLAASRTAAEQPAFDGALRSGSLSADQAHAVAKGASADPSALSHLLETAATAPVGQLRDEARATALKAQSPDDLYTRQRAARTFRHWRDDLGMACGSYRLTPEVGAALEAAVEREAKRLHRVARRTRSTKHGGANAPYEHHLADALAHLVTGEAQGTGAGAEVVIDIPWEALTGGAGHCEVRGAGPIPVSVAREVMEHAFLKAVVTEGTDVRLVKHFGRRPSAQIRTALEWKHRACVDCGSRFHLEHDHVNPWANGGETSYANLVPRCWPCHVRKTDDDRRQGLLGPDPPRRRGP